MGTEIPGLTDGQVIYQGSLGWWFTYHDAESVERAAYRIYRKMLSGSTIKEIVVKKKTHASGE